MEEEIDFTKVPYQYAMCLNRECSKANTCLRLLTAQSVISHLMSYFGRRTYYRIRKGERLLTPSEQQRILNILKNCGATHLQNFDAYVEDYDW